MKNSAFNKVSIVSLLIVCVLAISGCGNDPFMVDVSYQSKEAQENNQKLLNEYLEKYKNATEKGEKSEYATEIGFRYMLLGNYHEAIKYYEEVIAYDAVHFPALNNLASMYEEAGDTRKALEYEQKLYEANPTNQEVVTDTIRLLVKNNMFTEARGVLESFSKYDKENGSQYDEFISEQFNIIRKAKEKAVK